MNPLRLLTTPEYLFRPRQILHRLRRMCRPPQPVEEVVLPWGHTIRVNTKETIGANIYAYGLFDLDVAETIWRVLGEGERAVDIGANIGQMTSLMRCRAGASGHVTAFEPHPALVAEIETNMRANDALPGAAPVRIEGLALGSAPGEATLDAGPHWEGNRGMSKLIGSDEALTGHGFKVRVATLDECVGETPGIGVCKIDVEGHELQVLEGARGLLSRKQIRDVIFEDFTPYPGPVPQLLLDHGYRVFRLHSALFGPSLQPGETAAGGLRPTGNYLATLDPDRARERFRTRGWQVLRGASKP